MVQGAEEIAFAENFALTEAFAMPALSLVCEQLLPAAVCILGQEAANCG